MTVDHRAGYAGWTWFRKTGRILGVAVAVAAGLAVSSGDFGLAGGQPADAENVGLNGILRDEVPDGLLETDFAVLPETWQEWGAETAAEISTLYDEDLDLDAQRSVIDSLQARVDTMEEALRDSRYRSIHDELRMLRGRLSRRVDLAEAILNTLVLDPEEARANRLERARADVVAAARRLRDRLDDLRGGRGWFEYVNGPELLELADASTDVAALQPVLADTVAAITERREDRLQSREQAEFLSQPAFLDVRDAARELHRLLTAPPPEENAEAVRNQLAELVDVLETYESENTEGAANRVRDLLAELERSTLDGGRRLWDAVLENYLNYNLRVVAGEEFVAKLTDEQRIEDGPVRDYLLGTRVYGQQRTDTTVRLDLQPNDERAEFDVVLTGTTRSNTTGYNPDATVRTTGRHHFRARKPVLFDGREFVTRPATISVDANNNTYAARTKFSDVPLLGHIADDIALREAARKRPQSEAHARMRLRQRVLPEFNQQAGEDFALLNEDLGKLNERLRERGLFPDTYRYRTTEDRFLMHARVTGPNELGGGKAGLEDAPSNSATVYLHESLLNNALDRLDLAGKTMSETEVVAHLSEFFSDLAGREIEIEPPEDPDPSQFVFAEEDPVRVRIAEGQINVTVRTGLKREGEEDLPVQEVTIPLDYTVEGDMIKVTRGTVKVSLRGGLATAAVLRRRMQTAIPEVRTRDATFVHEREGLADVPLRVSAIDAVNGWLSLTLE